MACDVSVWRVGPTDWGWLPSEPVSGVVVPASTALRPRTSPHGEVLRIAARPSIVFDALTTPDGIARWWDPGNAPGALARPARAGHMAPMMISRTRLALALSALTAAAALAGATAAERHGLVPCALCLIERWPYWIALALALAGLALPRALGRVALGCCWPRCWAAPRWRPCMWAWRRNGGPARCRNVRRPASPAAPSPSDWPACRRVPSKPCDEPTYLIPALPLSTAGLNLIFAWPSAAPSPFSSGAAEGTPHERKRIRNRRRMAARRPDAAGGHRAHRPRRPCRRVWRPPHLPGPTRRARPRPGGAGAAADEGSRNRSISTPSPSW